MPARDVAGLVLSIGVAGAMFWGCSFPIQQLIMGDLLAAAGGKFKFLTILNMHLQLIYFLICILNFFVGSNTLLPEKRTRLQKVRDYLFAGAVFPTGTFVCLTFWGLYHFDRRLIFPEHLDLIVSPTFNHVMHTLPGIAIWLENLVHYHRYPSRVAGLLCVLAISGAYTAWIHYLNHVHWLEHKINLWVYPILNQLSLMHRGLFLSGSALFNVGLYFVGEAYTRVLAGMRAENVRTNKKKKN